MKPLLLPAMLLLLSGCITINFNQAPRSTDDKATTTRQQSSDQDETEDCDEQLRSATQLVGSTGDPRHAVSSGLGKRLAEDQEDTCLEDESGLHRRQKTTSRRATFRSTSQNRLSTPQPATPGEGTGAEPHRSNHL